MSYDSSLDLMQEIQHRVPDIDIRDEQIEALDAIELNEAAGNTASLVVAASGIGKTVMMAAYARRKLVDDPMSRVLFLVHSNNLLEQAEAAFKPIIGEEFDTGIFSGENKDYDERSVLFASFQVMREWRDAFGFTEFEHGIVDESHTSKAPTYEPTVRRFEFKHLLGMTATPDRLDLKNITDIYGQPVYELGFGDAVARGLLAPADYHIITDDLVQNGRVIDLEGNEHKLGEFRKDAYAPLREQEIQQTIEEYGARINGPVKRIVFCQSIEEADRYSELFGDSAASFHSNITPSTRKELLQAFREDQLNTMLVVSMFDEGIDIPNANQIVFLRGTDSKRIFLQQLGRGLRKAPGKESVQVLDFVNNAERLLMVDRVWRDAARIAGVGTEDDNELLTINLSDIHFDHETRRIMRILRHVEDDVYMPEQIIAPDSVRETTLARRLGLSPAALRAIASSLSIQPRSFPTRNGKAIPYYLEPVAELLEDEFYHLREQSTTTLV